MHIIRTPASKIRNGFIVIHEYGFLELMIRTLQKVQKITRGRFAKKWRMLMLADEKSVLNAEWATKSKKFKQSIDKSKATKTLNWIMSPPGESSGGGHQNIFRFIKYLDDAGYRNVVYLYSTRDFATIDAVCERVQSFYNLDPQNVVWLKGDQRIEGGDAIIATGWETAYPSYNAELDVPRFYFVQDFEPLFYPLGSEYILAENTYRFGFTGITAGGWLKQKLGDDYGMTCHSYEFGAEPSLYEVSNSEQRKEVFFYARPVTARRGFELGIMALHKFHEMHPDYIINLAGWDVSDCDIPFPYVNHKALKIHELSDLYNRCAVALVISLTNMSLLPLELLACGTIPVVNDGPNNRLVSDNEYIKYAKASPDALAQAMAEVVLMNDLPTYATTAAESVATDGWDKSGEKVIHIIEEQLYG